MEVLLVSWHPLMKMFVAFHVTQDINSGVVILELVSVTAAGVAWMVHVKQVHSYHYAQFCCYIICEVLYMSKVLQFHNLEFNVWKLPHLQCYVRHKEFSIYQYEHFMLKLVQFSWNYKNYKIFHVMVYFKTNQESQLNYIGNNLC